MKSKNGPVKIYFDPKYIQPKDNKEPESIIICTRDGKITEKDKETIRKFVERIRKKAKNNTLPIQ